VVDDSGRRLDSGNDLGVDSEPTAKTGRDAGFDGVFLAISARTGSQHSQLPAGAPR
jgi:hypothetical protein